MEFQESYVDRLGRAGATSLAVLTLLVSLGVLPLLAKFLPAEFSAVVGYASLAIFFGELVGFSEISLRYRDEPLRATFNRYGVVYLTINGVLSGCAFYLLRAYGDRIFPAAKDPPLLAAVVAGFGAMAIFRSKLFVFRTDDGKEIPIGPDIVLTSVLRLVDRKIDRMRAARRQQLVFELAKRVAAVAGQGAAFDNPNSFVIISLASFQNLSEDEKQQIVEKSDELTEKLKDKPSLFKAMVLGFMVLDIAGEENFRDIMEDLVEYLRDSGAGPPPPRSDVPPPAIPTV